LNERDADPPKREQMRKTAGDREEAEHGYRRKLRDLQIELVKFQTNLIKRGDRILVLVEGRDAAGKDGVINISSNI
jgi:polyphosphate kinase 2 (PPK2 family)